MTKVNYKGSREEFAKGYEAAVSDGKYMASRQKHLSVRAHDPSISQKINKMASKSRSRSRSRAPTTKMLSPRSSRSTSRGRSAKRQKVPQIYRGKGPVRFATTSKSGGFFGSGTRAAKKKAMIKVQKKGANHTMEVSDDLSAVDAAWIGHVTFCRNVLYREAVICLYAEILRRAGTVINSVADETKTMVLNTQIIIEYKLTNTGNYATSPYVFGVGQATATDFVNWWLSVSRPWYGNAETEFGRIWIKGPVASDETYMQINMANMKCHFEIKSTLKIQNQTVATAGDDEDDVNNVPLYGKSYNFNGTQLKQTRPYIGNGGGTVISQDLSANVDLGVISYVNSSELPEPVQGPVEFRGLKAIGKAHLDPGQVKTSVLTDTINMYFSTLFKSFMDDIPSISVQRARNFGKGRIFALEKMINVLGSLSLKIAYEHNYEVSTSVKLKQPIGLIKSFSKFVN